MKNFGKKSILILIAVLILAISVLPAQGGKEKKSDEVVIGFANFFAGANAYCSYYTQTFENRMKAMDGVKAIHLDARGDPAVQLDQINDLIARDVDVILLWPVDGVAVIPGVRRANEAGIPVLVTNSPVHESAYPLTEGFTGPNNVEEGMLAAELMAEGLKGKGRIVEITGTPGYVTAIERTQGFMDKIAEYPGIQVLDSQPADWDREKAQTVMENFLVRYPDIDGVYCHDSGIAMGALNAIKAANKKGIIITDATLFGDGYDQIEAGWLYGSVYQSPVADAELAIETAIKVARGEKIPFFNYIETPKVDVLNYKNYDRPPF